MSTRSGTRDSRGHVLDVAEALFLREGVRATGVDTISAEAAVAKTTLYRHYPTKDDLIRAYLHRRADAYFAWLRQATESHVDPRAQLDAVVDLYAEAVTAPGFTGCPFLNVASEFADPAHPARRFTAEHKTAVVAFFADLARRAGARDPEELANALALLTDGASEAGRITGAGGPAGSYRTIARQLIADAVHR